MALPRFTPDGNLPKGIHTAGWKEFSVRCLSTPHRRALLDGLRRALLALNAAGCRTAYVDGSFVTAKIEPADFDACWDDLDVDLAKLDPVLLDFAHKRAKQRAKYLGELFPANAAADAIGRTFLDFFQIDMATGKPKGIVRLDLRRLR